MCVFCLSPRLTHQPFLDLITVDNEWDTSTWCWTCALFKYDLHNELAFGRRGVSEERLYTQSG